MKNPLHYGGIYCCFRVIFITCVPLFLLLTGYLHSVKKISVPSRKYYWGLFKVVLSYIVSGIVCQTVLGFLNGFNFKSIIISFFTFTAAPYGWYIGLYCGLYLSLIHISEPTRP